MRYFQGLRFSLALVPEAVAFSIIASVDPLIGLYSAFFLRADHRGIGW